MFRQCYTGVHASACVRINIYIITDIHYITDLKLRVSKTNFHIHTFVHVLIRINMHIHKHVHTREPLHAQVHNRFADMIDQTHSIIQTLMHILFI